MKIGILETGYPPGALASRFGDYPRMFADLLGEDFEIHSFDVQAGEMPDTSAGLDAFLITGSPAGVYEPLPWIAPLEEFVRASGATPMIGVCFGHQLMAQALGGKVEKSGKGWGAGLHRYEVVQTEPWMDGTRTIRIPASHQDQVVVQPPATRVLAASAFTPFAALGWMDRPAISFQFHPEFSPEFAKALIEQRYDVVPDPDAAIASLNAPNDNRVVAGWIQRFLRA